MSDSEKLQDLDSMLCDEVNVADYEELQIPWIDNAVTDSHDANDLRPKTDADAPCDGRSREESAGAAMTARKASNTSPFPTDDALSPLELQVDRETAAHVFRMTPAPSHSGKSETSAGRGGSDTLEDSGRRHDGSRLDEFSSIITRLTSSARIDADDDDLTGGLAGFGAKSAPADTPLIVRSAPAQASHQLHKDGPSDSKPRAAKSAADEEVAGEMPIQGEEAHTIPHASPKAPPPASIGTSRKPSAKRKRRTGASTTAKPAKSKKPTTRNSIKPSPVAMAPDPASVADSVPPQATGRENAAKGVKSIEKKSIQPSAVVGPSSTQMQVVFRMVDYMTRTYTNPKLVRDIRDAVALCTAEHKKNVRAFAHLPGSILDHLLDVLDPVEFIRVFNLFKPSSVRGSAGTASSGLALPDYFAQGQTKIDESDSRSPGETKPTASAADLSFNVSPVGFAAGPPFTMTTDQEYIPDLLEAAVGYGFHLASLHPHSTDVDLHTLLSQGARTVWGMDLTERKLLWKYLLNKEETDNPPRQHEHASSQSQTGEPSSSAHSQRSSQSSMNQDASDHSPEGVAGVLHHVRSQSPQMSSTEFAEV